jgi:8-oxo-dGTP diphosphatase
MSDLPKEEKPHIRVVAAEVIRDGHFLITQRKPGAVLPLMWEFPGGRVEGKETDEVALARELHEKVGIGCTVGGLSMHVAHEYDRYTLDLLVYRVHTDDTPQPIGVHEVRWVLPTDFDQYEFPGADQLTVDALLG